MSNGHLKSYPTLKRKRGLMLRISQPDLHVHVHVAIDQLGRVIVLLIQ